MRTKVKSKHKNLNSNGVFSDACLLRYCAQFANVYINTNWYGSTAAYESGFHFFIYFTKVTGYTYLKLKLVDCFCNI